MGKISWTTKVHFVFLVLICMGYVQIFYLAGSHRVMTLLSEVNHKFPEAKENIDGIKTMIWGVQNQVFWLCLVLSGVSLIYAYASNRTKFIKVVATALVILGSLAALVNSKLT